MDEQRWERWGAGAGIVAVILLVGGTFLAPQPPHVDAPTVKIVAWVTAHRRAILAQNVLGMFSAAAFVWFVAHLRHVLQRAENGAEALAPVVFASGTAMAALFAVGGAPIVALAFLAGQPGGAGGAADAPVVRVLNDLSGILYAPALVIMVVFMGAWGLAMLRHELLNPTLGWAAIVVGAVNGLAAVLLWTVSSYSAFAVVVIFAGLLGFAAVLLAASVTMLRTPEATRRPVLITTT